LSVFGRKLKIKSFWGSGVGVSERRMTASALPGPEGEGFSFPKVYGKIVITLDNVLIPKEKLSPTPSFLDGLDPESEADLRIIGCELIQTSGILLKLPQTAMATGQVLFQRFYYSKSFVRQPMETTAMACVYLASKIEEAPRRIRDVINVFYHIKQVRANKIIQPLVLDPSYIRLKSDVTLAERRVLKELGFCVHVKHPHKLIVLYVQQLGYDKNVELLQRSWNYMNDSLRSNVFVRFTPESIACACIFLSARVLGISLPTNPPWYSLFDVTHEDIVEICTIILELYSRPKVNIESLEKTVDALSKAYQESRSRAKHGASTPPTDTKAGKVSLPVNANNSSLPGSPIRHPELSSGPRSKDQANEEIRKRPADDGSYDHDSHTRQSRRDRSPVPKKARKSPSPIVYNDSPPRHKHKKRKKSRYSSSGSRSRSRSRSHHRDRRDRKKSHRHDRDRERERSRSPSRHHHSSKKSSYSHRY
jgi:transcription initiation factor TFIIIB Brf1 subunit/transcription initiation factor TFIIB